MVQAQAGAGMLSRAHVQVLGQGCCAEPGLADPSLLPEMQKHKLRCVFSRLFNHLLNSVLAPVSARLQPCGNRPALIHVEEGLLSLGRCRSAGEVTLLQFADQMGSCRAINLFPIQFR